MQVQGGSYKGTTHELRIGSTHSVRINPILSALDPSSKRRPLNPSLHITNHPNQTTGSIQTTNKRSTTNRGEPVIGIASSESHRSLLGRSVDSLPTQLPSIHPHPTPIPLFQSFAAQAQAHAQDPRWRASTNGTYLSCLPCTRLRVTQLNTHSITHRQSAPHHGSNWL